MKEFWLKNKDKILEFLRYVLVGGLAAVVDIFVNWLVLYKILQGTKDDIWKVIVAVALGFIFGTIVNFTLSNLFVFRKADQQKRGKTVKGFVISLVIGLIGLGLTELFTFIGTRFIPDGSLIYVILSCFVKVIVLFWNFIARKIFIYK